MHQSFLTILVFIDDFYQADSEDQLLLKREKFAVSLRKEQKKKILNAKRRKLMTHFFKPSQQPISSTESTNTVNATNNHTNSNSNSNSTATEMQTDSD